MDPNLTCHCHSLDFSLLTQQFAQAGIATLPPFFASSATYITRQQLTQMEQIITAIEAVIRLPSYQTKVLEQAPAIAQIAYPAAGVFMGYDFHLSPQGPQLIEINTNAGGAMLNALLAKALRPCVHQTQLSSEDNAEKLVTMFQQEWQLMQPEKPLTCIAIIDDNPQQQFLYPEFVLFKQLFAQHGIPAFIADPRELVFKSGKVQCNGQTIDLIYNRETDFYFAQHPHLAEAYQTRAVVMTPHPRAHALYANKHNLAILTDAKQLQTWAVEPPLIETLLNGIPRTFKVDPTYADELWQQRKPLFFKPLSGYGSKGTYRGDRITHKVFNEILTHDHVAQTYAPPSERHLLVDGKAQVFKVDIRCYVYQGQIQLMAARLYQGQTTNFRTPGGGFSAIASYPD